MVAGAVQQAVLACLAEIAGTDAPSSERAESLRRRARRHAGRAIGLTRMAIRVNVDPQIEPLLASLLERHERCALRVEQLATRADGPTVQLAR